MEFLELTESEFMEFAKNHENASFMQCKEAADLKKRSGWDFAYVGVKENNQILAATLLASMPVMRIFRYFYTNRGPLLDFDNQELVQFFMQELKKYCRKRKGLYVRIDPNTELSERDINGDKVVDGYDHHNYIEYMKKSGAYYLGETIGFNDSSQVRWEFVKSLKDEDEASVLKNLDQQTRWSVNKALKTGIEVRFLEKEELPLFKEVMEHTSARRGFNDRDLAFYQQFFDAYGKEQIKIPYATLNLNKYEENMLAELRVHEAELEEVNKMLLEQPNSKKFNKKLKVVNEAIEIALRRVKEAQTLRSEKGDELVLATAFFITQGNHEIVYLFSGAYDEYLKFNGPYAIQWTMLKYALNHGFEIYNFYGTSGDFSKDAIDYGVYEFKKGFGGKVVELIGDFILPVHPLFKVYNQIKKIV